MAISVSCIEYFWTNDEIGKLFEGAVPRKNTTVGLRKNWLLRFLRREEIYGYVDIVVFENNNIVFKVGLRRISEELPQNMYFMESYTSQWIQTT